jgi:nucleoside-diphosphate-sugar epimerase
MNRPVPRLIESIEELDAVLSWPAPGLIDCMRSLDGDILILGGGGKMGPSLARLARRAIDASGRPRSVTCVSRFTDMVVQRRLEADGIRTMACDLLHPGALSALPDAPYVIYLAGRKFGATENQPMTWAVNAYLPGLVMQRYAGSRIVVLSTGNVYPFTSVASHGANEDAMPSPIGEYAQSCLGRERMTEYWSTAHGTPAAIVRLNYAIDLRYGVLLDIGLRVRHGEPIDLRMGHVNLIWQGDANTAILSLLAHTAVPPLILNVTGERVLSVRDIAMRFGERCGKQPRFTEKEEPLALLSDARRFHALLPFEHIAIETMIEWTAHWIRIGGDTLSKPTHYQEREGRF